MFKFAFSRYNMFHRKRFDELSSNLMRELEYEYQTRVLISNYHPSIVFIVHCSYRS